MSDRVAWASGRSGTVLRTVDGGETWQVRPVPGAETLAFCDVQAIDADVAYVLTNNGGTNARIYKTVDGGASWTLQFQGPPALGTSPHTVRNQLARLYRKVGVCTRSELVGLASSVVRRATH